MPKPLPAAARCYALVPGAGVGRRAGAGVPKQYAPLAGRPLVAHTLQALRAVAAIEATLVVLSAGDEWFEPLVPAAEHPRDWLARVGGETRAQTVANGLAELRRRGAADDDWVLVHDAARCLLQPAWVRRLIEACSTDAVGGLLALPVSDTLKRGGGGGGGDGRGDARGQDHRVQQTVPRQGLWQAQTPQMFRVSLLQRALAQAGPEVTDEASAVEALGLQPLLVEGAWENLKITWPADFGLAERLLASRGSST